MLVTSSLRGGGAERMASELSNAWARTGHEVVLVPTFPVREEPAYPLDDRVRLVLPEVQPRRKTPLGQLRRLLRLRRLMQSERPDVVIAFLTHVNVATLAAAIGLNLPVVISERTHPTLYELSLAQRWARRWLYPRAARLVVQTRRAADFYEAQPGMRRVTVIPNPLRLPLPRTPPIIDPSLTVPAHARVVLSVGRLDDNKGHADLIEAFARLGKGAASWHLVILGEGDRRPALEKMIRDRGLSDRVLMPGWAGNVGDWYERAEIFVLSSRYEGFPNALLEAMGHGKACISYDCESGPAEIIRDGVNGLLVDPRRGTDGLTCSLTDLLGDEPQIRALGAQARGVAATYSQETVLTQWTAVLDAAATGRR